MKFVASIHGLALLLTGLFCSATILAQPLVPFGEGVAVKPGDIKPKNAQSVAIECFGPEMASRWEVESPAPDQTTPPFAIEDQDGRKSLRIETAALTPNRSTVRILLPGDGPANGDVWARIQAGYISFLCSSQKPATLSLHLLQRGKSAGSYQARFSAEPGEWRRIILPIDQFGLRSFRNVAGIGFRVVRADEGTNVSISDLRVGSVPYTDDSWKSRRVAISLAGEWRFAVDPAERGMQETWHADRFDDSAWKVLRAGLPWEAQGIDHYGWGWYRQQIFVPKELEGVPMSLTLAKIASDDDAWFNGRRVGGWSGEYKYENQLLRSYTIPAEQIRYGQNNSIALRFWGGDLSFIGKKSGLVSGPLVAELDPYRPRMRVPGGKAVPAELFDLSDAQHGMPLEIVFPFPAEMAREPGVVLNYRLSDALGNGIQSGRVPLAAPATGPAEAVVAIDRQTSQILYLRGRLRATLILEDAAGRPLYIGSRAFDQLSFARRDLTPLAELPQTVEPTPYGQLKLIDEIDCSAPLADEAHPYLQSGYDHALLRMTPGGPVDVKVRPILGKPARETPFGWFAYRIGRGKLKPHSMYLLRIEYPEDQPRFAAVEVQTGQNYMDIGWKNGVGKDDVYDNWPLSRSWQWFDVIVPLDDQTVGTGGTGSAAAENGFWIYFMNKMKPGVYYSMWSAGPAVGRIKLYEIDAEKNAPVIERPKGLPSRILSFDWERQPDHHPDDLVRYAKLMGYNAISPVILKWAFANYSDPLNGYRPIVIDDRDYWAGKDYDPAKGQDATSPIPLRQSQHARYLQATKEYGVRYIPRIEWGGSLDLPKQAWAMDVNGEPTKPNRFAKWCTNLLHPAAWDDLQKLMEHLIKPYAKDNPQLSGVLWRIRSNRLPISYGPDDIRLFSSETGTPLPLGAEAQWAAWAAGEIKAKYDAWWHEKRARFHARLVNLLKSYRDDLAVYYYNWDGDKFSLIEPDLTAWAFVQNVVKTDGTGGKAAYLRERDLRKTFTAEDYIAVLRTGNFGRSSNGLNRADLGIRPELYKQIAGIQLFAPANWLCYANLPDYLNYFQTSDGLAVSNPVSYDEIASRAINPKFEGNMIVPAGPPFSMALELLAYFHGDARTLNYTVYTYGRGFAQAHRRFAQAFLALPAIPGSVVDQGDDDLKVRIYPCAGGRYLGVAYRGYEARKLSIRIPQIGTAATVKDLVSRQTMPARIIDGELRIEIDSGPMELNAFLIE